MSSLFQTVPAAAEAPRDGVLKGANPWLVGLGVLAGVLVLAGVVTAWIGLGDAANFPDSVLGQQQGYDFAIAVSIVGGAAIVLGIVVGAGWAVMCAQGWARSHPQLLDQVPRLD